METEDKAAVWVPEDDRAFAIPLARYCARNPVTVERLTYDRTAKTVTYRSDKSEGPPAGTGACNWRWVLPALGTAPATRRLRRSASIELTAALVVPIITAVLVATPMPVKLAGTTSP